MKRYLILGIVILVLIFIGAGAVIVLQAHKQVVANPSPSFPIASSTNASGTGVSTVTIATQDGNRVVVKDFIHNGVTAHDTQNPGNYYLVGAVGYCNADGTCPSGAPSDEYNVVYFSQDKSFIVGLIKEPIGLARLDAEQFLMTQLGLTQAQMCNLKYQVLTSSDVNDFYAGENLGFSFCSGAVKLP